VVFHTDGVTEARDAQGRFFGLDRLARRLRQQSREKAATLAGGMAAAGRDWAHVPCDDMSVMVIKKT
jgi:serine phosphatase RsbU (regulator of sigma subunit)